MATRTRVHRPNQRADPPDDLALNLLARELIVARIRVGLRQHQVAHRLGTTQSAISRLEGATGHRPSFVTLERYADAVGCDLVVTLRRRPFPWEADPSDLA
jgi:transcriptional regulator with XRE-family HTH domain